MTDVKVALSDKREYEAQIVLRDQRTDLAVLRIKGDGHFPTIELGDSDALEVGDLALAIGNPFGVGQTVTQGIISALARTQVGINDYGFFIQTDAAINPGNSGGALVDLDRSARGHQFGDLFALGRLNRHRLRDPRQHGEGRSVDGKGRRAAGAPAMGRGDRAGRVAGDRRLTRPRSADGRARVRCDRWKPCGGSPGSRAATSSPR